MPTTGREARHLELEQAICDVPGDLRAWQVYADWLQSHGDAWGERLSLGLARGRGRSRDHEGLDAAIAQLDQAARETFLGPLAAWLDAPDFDRVAQLEWAHGFVVGVRVGVPRYGRAIDDATTPEAILAAVLASPAARFLQSITIGLVDAFPRTLQSMLDVIVAGGVRPCLRTLFVGDFAYPDETEISWLRVGDLAPVLARLPRLRHLHLRGGGIELGSALVHPTLETLLIESGGLPGAALRALGRAELPSLTHMRVWLGRRYYGGTGSARMLLPLLSGQGVPRLRHLGLMNGEIQDELAAALAKSRLLAQLEVIDLSMGTLGDAGGQAILDAAARFAHLRRLELDHNYLSPALADALVRALGPIVSIGTIETPEVWDGQAHYFTQVGE